MFPNNAQSVIVTGVNLEYVLFKCAFFYAEQGLRVWFISPQSFETLPKEIVAPDKDILKLITFLYLDDYKELISHANDIHNWHQMPNVIIVNNYEHYCTLSSNFDYLKIAFITSSLLDAVSTCSHKHCKKSLLLVCLNTEDFVIDSKLKVLLHTYFRDLIELSDTCDKTVAADEIIRMANIV